MGFPDLRASSGKSPTARSLGYSLAQGFKPNGDLAHGYAEQLHASLAADQPKLRIVKLGCGGESGYPA